MVSGRRERSVEVPLGIQKPWKWLLLIVSLALLALVAKRVMPPPASNDNRLLGTWVCREHPHITVKLEPGSIGHFYVDHDSTKFNWRASGGVIAVTFYGEEGEPDTRSTSYGFTNSSSLTLGRGIFSGSPCVTWKR